MKAKRTHRLIILAMLAAGLAMWALPTVYEHHTVFRLRRTLDRKFGANDWAVVWMSADLQGNQRIQLYRTLYVRCLFPLLQDFTPWKDLRFTHKTAALIRPWHFVVCVASPHREVTYYWSMKGDGWVEVWNNPLNEGTFGKMRGDVIRVKGLNQVRHPENWSGL